MPRCDIPLPIERQPLHQKEIFSDPGCLWTNQFQTEPKCLGMEVNDDRKEPEDL